MTKLGILTVVAAVAAASGVASSPARASALDACGSHQLPIVMERVPAGTDPWYGINDNHVWLWNQYMPIYSLAADDGVLGANGRNEFAGFPSDAELYDAWGLNWRTGDLAITLSWLIGGCADPIAESDVAFNPAYVWTTDRAGAVGDNAVVYYPSVLLHEMGHTWGAKLQNEDYNYIQPTVMHGYVVDVLQDDMTIHAGDANLVRVSYKGQAGSVPSLVNMAVVSKYADSSLGFWRNTTTDAASYYAGDPITLSNLTVENTGTVPLDNVRVRLYLSPDRTITADDRSLGEFYWPAAFPAERYAVQTVTVAVPTTVPAGTYYVGAIVTNNGYSTDAFGFDDTTYLPAPITVKRGSITVASPNGGEAWAAATTRNITWTTTGNTGGAVRIELGRGSGNWSTIAASAGNTRSYAWAIPIGQAPGTDYRIRVTSAADGAVTDDSDANFEIAVPGTITVASPNGGEAWAAATTRNIAWTTTGNTGSAVRIELGRGSGNWSTIAASAGNTGSYAWAIPIGQAPGTDYRIRVTSAANAAVADNSDANFEIAVPGAITVTSPNGGEAWTAGSAHNIAWTTTGTVGPAIEIDLTWDNGYSSRRIASAVNAVSPYPWAIPTYEAPGNYYRIRVTASAALAVTDTSNGDFAIAVPTAITVASPNGGEAWTAGTTQTIRWKTIGYTGSTVRIELAAGSGNWSTIAPNANDTGSYTWAIPPGQAPGTDYRIRITADNGLDTDSSDAPFTINVIPTPLVPDHPVSVTIF